MKIITILGERSRQKKRLVGDVTEYFDLPETDNIEILDSDGYDDLVQYQYTLQHAQDYLSDESLTLVAHRLIVAEHDYSDLQLWDHVFIYPVFTMPGIEQVYVTRLADWGITDTVVWLPSDRDLAADKVRAIVEGETSA